MNLEERVKKLEDRVTQLERDPIAEGMEKLGGLFNQPQDAASSIKRDAEKIKNLRKK